MTRILLLLLFVLASPLAAQRTAFSYLMQGTVAYRAPWPWTVVSTQRAAESEGVLLEYQEDRDTALTMAIFAYTVPRSRALKDWSDSVLTRAIPSSSAERVADSLSTGARATLWSDGALIVMDRFENTPDGILWVRASLQARKDQPVNLRARMLAIDDLLTTIRTDHGLLFPKGSELGIIVY